MDFTGSRGTGGVRPVSGEASRAFGRTLPRLLSLVNDKFSVDARLISATAPEQLALICDAHRHFGEMLRAVFEFSLFEHMVDEFRWYASAMTSRGLDEGYFRKMVEAWIIAVHAAVPHREARELSRPLEWLAASVGRIYGRVPGAGPRLDSRAGQFLAFALAKKRRDAVDYALSLLRKGDEAGRVVSDVILPAMAEVGRLWEANEISVSDEHAATEISRYALQRIMDEVPREAALDLKAIVGCVPGEQHDIGAMLTAAHMEAKGWEVVYLGRSTPEEDLIRAIERERPDVCVFSITLIARLPSSRDLFDRLRAEVPGTRIAVGGHAARLAADTLSPHVDAVVGDVQEAHRAALRLAGRHA